MLGRHAAPHVLIAFRFAAGPVILALACAAGRDAGPPCAGLLALGVLSDIFDGVIARRLGCATPALRKLDSRADVAFWLCTALAAWKMCPAVRTSLTGEAVILVGLELVAPAVSLRRFGQEASTHHLLSKVFGLGLWGLMTRLFLHGSAGWVQPAVFALGVASQLEGIAIMLVIPVWRADVRSLSHAVELRRRVRLRSGIAQPRRPARRAGSRAQATDFPRLR